MRKIHRFFLLGSAAILALTACQTSEDLSNVDLRNISFASTDVVQKSFGGIGVEWGAYEDTDKLVEGGWERVLEHMDHLRAARIRLMINYDWFCQNFDDKGTEDKNDDTWTYNFTNKYAMNMLDILDYCQTHDIDVAFGAWNVIGNFDNDVWNMMEEVTSDVRWAKITGDVLDFLVNKKGYTCIKWFVNSNEPNLTGSYGTSKNYNNTFEIWGKGVRNVRKTLDSLGLKKIGIVGGDTTGFEESEEYLLGIANNLKGKVGDYGIHLYLSNIAVDRGEMFDDLNSIISEIKKRDSGLFKSRQIDIWEAGLRDGKTPLDCQSLINTGSYAVRMIDYTVQSLAAGVNGVVYWDFDDAMHFMYTNNTVTPKEWGMFSSLAEASSDKQELRPWYHSSSLLCHLFEKGNKIYSPVQNNNQLDNNFRSLATINKEGTKGGFVAINTGLRPTTKTFYVDEKLPGDKLYIYTFNDNLYRLNDEGYIIPNYVIDGSLNKKITLEIPNSTAVIVSNEEL